MASSAEPGHNSLPGTFALRLSLPFPNLMRNRYLFLVGSLLTLNVHAQTPTLLPFRGNLHAHSKYSDGNQDGTAAREHQKGWGNRRHQVDNPPGGGPAADRLAPLSHPF